MEKKSFFCVFTETKLKVTQGNSPVRQLSAALESNPNTSRKLKEWKLKDKQAEYKEEVKQRNESTPVESLDVYELWNQTEKVAKEVTEQMVGRTSGKQIKEKEAL